MATEHQTRRINAYAVIQPENQVTVGITIPVLSGTLNWALSTIPTATISVSLGRNVLNGTAVDMDRLVGHVRQTTPIAIYMRIRPQYSSTGEIIDEWPTLNGDYAYIKVFEGRLVGMGTTRSRTQASAELHIKHWLDDLDFSSAITRQTNQVTTEMLNANASYLTSDGVGSGFLPRTMAAEYFTPGNAQDDLWGSSFMPWLRRICALDALSSSAAAVPGTNAEALNAVSRIEPILVVDPNNPTVPPVPTYYFGVPLRLENGGVVSGANSLCTAIAEDVALTGSDGMMATSLWGKMLQWAAEYKFAVVPMVETAAIVPFTAGQRVHWATIYGQEYSQISISAELPRAIRGVRLFGGVGAPTGLMAGLSAGNAGALPLFAGGYDNPDFPSGMLRFQNAPRWAANVAAPSAYGSAVLLPPSPGANTMFPGAGPPPTVPAPGDINQQAAGLWDSYARAVYINEVLRYRTASIQGKLRFDIAPGSTVRVQVVAEKFVRQQLGVSLDDVIFGEVLRVTCHFDSESMQASTAFQLANIRSAEENGLESLSTAAHPFYSVPWVGAPLCAGTLPSAAAINAFDAGVAPYTFSGIL